MQAASTVRNKDSRRDLAILAAVVLAMVVAVTTAIIWSNYDSSSEKSTGISSESRVRNTGRGNESPGIKSGEGHPRTLVAPGSNVQPAAPKPLISIQNGMPLIEDVAPATERSYSNASPSQPGHRAMELTGRGTTLPHAVVAGTGNDASTSDCAAFNHYGACIQP